MTCRVFFNWFPPKNPKCQLELFWRDLLCNLTLKTFWPEPVKKHLVSQDLKVCSSAITCRNIEIRRCKLHGKFLVTVKLIPSTPYSWCPGHELNQNMHPAAMNSWDSGGAENLTGASGRGLCSPSNIFLWILHFIHHLQMLSVTPSIKCSPCMCNMAGQRRGLLGSLLIIRSWGRGAGTLSTVVLDAIWGSKKVESD